MLSGRGALAFGVDENGAYRRAPRNLEEPLQAATVWGERRIRGAEVDCAVRNRLNPAAEPIGW